MITHIDHINISVSNIEISKEFYINILGFKIIKEGLLKGDFIDLVVGLKGVSARYIQLKIPNSETNLELIEYFSPLGENNEENKISNTIGIRHIAFNVKNIENIYEKLKKSGVILFSNLQKYGEHKRLCYFYGPDKEILELCEYK